MSETDTPFSTNSAQGERVTFSILPEILHDVRDDAQSDGEDVYIKFPNAVNARCDCFTTQTHAQAFFQASPLFPPGVLLLSNMSRPVVWPLPVVRIFVTQLSPQLPQHLGSCESCELDQYSGDHNTYVPIVHDVRTNICSMLDAGRISIDLDTDIPMILLHEAADCLVQNLLVHCVSSAA